MSEQGKGFAFVMVCFIQTHCHTFPTMRWEFLFYSFLLKVYVGTYRFFLWRIATFLYTKDAIYTQESSWVLFYIAIRLWASLFMSSYLHILTDAYMFVYIFLWFKCFFYCLSAPYTSRAKRLQIWCTLLLYIKRPTLSSSSLLHKVFNNRTPTSRLVEVIQ